MIVKQAKGTLEEIKKKLEKNEVFTYNRYGDGQLMIMDGWRGSNICHYYSPKLQDLLTLGLQYHTPWYLMGLQCGFRPEEYATPNSFGSFGNNDNLEKIVKKFVPDWGERDFYSAVAFQYGMLYYPELVKEILTLIASKKTVVVAGEHLKGCEKFFGTDKFISTVKTQAFDELEDYMNQIYESQPEILIVACGMAGNVMQYSLAKNDTGITTINIGSMADALLEQPTRGWIIENMDKIKEFKTLCKIN